MVLSLSLPASYSYQNNFVPERNWNALIVLMYRFYFIHLLPLWFIRTKYSLSQFLKLIILFSHFIEILINSFITSPFEIILSIKLISYLNVAVIQCVAVWTWAEVWFPLWCIQPFWIWPTTEPKGKHLHNDTIFCLFISFWILYLSASDWKNNCNY